MFNPLKSLKVGVGIAVFVAAAAVLLWLLDTGDMVASEFAWLLPRPDFRHETLAVEPPFIHVYKVDRDFARRIRDLDLRAEGFSAWERFDSRATIGGDRVSVSLDGTADEIWVARKHDVERQVGDRRIRDLLSEIYLDFTRSRIVLHCPHYYW